ncbi:hypothetical protein PHYSODRAFT_413086, partial [Phytophthora sojae]
SHQTVVLFFFSLLLNDNDELSEYFAGKMCQCVLKHAVGRGYSNLAYNVRVKHPGF